jgi:rhamnogalacturonyl hydrolase YesR
MHKRYLLRVALFIIPIILFYGCAGDVDDKKIRIQQALQDGAHYAINVLLDEDGKSRCDYNIILGEWFEYEPPWHTGQIIYALVETYRLTGDPAYLDAARRAGDWWISLEITDHPKLMGMVNAIHGDQIDDRIVFATVSDGTAGLFRLYAETGYERYASVPTSAGEWMLNHMYLPDYGLFYDFVHYETGEVLTEDHLYWGEGGRELYDIARPNNEGSLYKYMYEFTGDERYREVFIALCESLVEKQGPEGLWMDFGPNQKEYDRFHPRFNIWYAESLLDGFDMTGDERYLHAAKKTADRYVKAQQADGTIYYVNHLDGTYNTNSLCGSGISFAGILWLRLFQYGVGDEYIDNIERSLEWVLRNRYDNNHHDANLAGAFLETRMRHIHDGIWYTMRDLGTSFGLRFLADYYRYAYGDQF